MSDPIPNYDGRTFVVLENSAHGEVSSATRFEYHQRGDVVWAEYHGGSIERGVFVAKIVSSGQLDMRYSHVSADGEIRTGSCHSTPEWGADGRLRLHERWRWTDDDREGTSVLVEIEHE